ncbi:chromosomal replication initiator protein DnaA [Eubacteriales bacterium OttesenSCG-928-N13]|nr:chromosomal replication initiator protein DnaA [Eubacteriales bacterium OttesenSCG-928-N13]
MSERQLVQEDLWGKTLDMIRGHLNAVSFDTWFKPLEIMEITKDRIVLGIADQFAVETLRRRYNTMLHDAVQQAYGHEYELVFVNSNDPSSMSALNTSQQGALGSSMLNPKYTFDTFVVGNSNRFAHAASLAVAELPSEAYNPLFLYGGVGLGKTHLMHAIGHYIQNENPETKLLYITSENFTNELIAAIAKKTNQALRDKLRNVDVLMVDDIQFIAGKNATQEEFFHTFNELHSSGKQIIISSDRPPKDIPTLEERLRSRFEWGLIADIQKPDYETRLAILRRKADTEHIDVPDDVLSFIAEKVQSNIRELEGSLIRVNAEALLNQEPLTVEMAERSLSTIMGIRDERHITPDLIMQTVADYYHIDRSDLLSQRRNREITVPRQIAMYLTRDMTNLSTTRIGDAFGGRDHTTVMHACDKISDASRSNSQMIKTLETLKTMVKER